MWEICHRDPCATGCPNAADPEPVHICSAYKEGIYEGSKYFVGLRGSICLEWLREMSPQEIFELLGESMNVAWKISVKRGSCRGILF